MNARDIDLLSRLRITSVLLNRGGWIHAASIKISGAGGWSTTDGDPVLWKISLYSESGLLLRDLYVESDTIAGISVDRSQHDQPTA